MSKEPNQPTLQVVTTALINPKVEWGVLMIEGVQIPHITIHHPLYGAITCLIPREVGMQLSRGLLETCTENTQRQ